MAYIFNYNFFFFFRYLIKSERAKSRISNGKLVNSNDSNYYDCISPDEPFNIVTSSRLSPSKSSSTSTLVGGINMTFGQQQQEHTLDGQSMAKLLPCVSCSSRSRRLSWRSSLSTRSNLVLSPQQTVAISSDSLSSTINLCENMMSKLMAGGDVGQDNAVANKLNEIIEQLRSASKELDKLKEEYISIAPPEVLLHYFNLFNNSF